MHPGTRALLFSASVACACLAVLALALSFADLAMSRPRAALVDWERHASLGDYRERRRLLARMGRAVAVHPLDADQRLDLGRFFVWHAGRHAGGSERAGFYQRLAAERFAEAVRARPTWSFAWLLLAEQWATLGHDEARVLAALRRGQTLGPLEPGTQLKALWLGLPRWQRLAPDDHAALRAGLARLLASPAFFRPAAAIAVHHDREDLVRARLAESWQREALATILRGRRG